MFAPDFPDEAEGFHPRKTETGTDGPQGAGNVSG